MNLLKNTTALALTTLLVLGCASTPKTNPTLEAARADVQRVTSDPMSQEAAGIRLKKAEAALALADQAAKDRKPVEVVQHQAYLASHHAMIAAQQIAELRYQQEIAQGEANRNRVLLEARTSEVAAAQADAAAQAAGAQRARDQLGAATDETARLRAELEGLQAKQTERGMVLTLGDVLFATGQTDIRPGAMLTVDRLAEFLRAHATLQVMIEGHTDSVGDGTYNQNLSQRRSDAVRAALVARGVANDHIRSRGMGENYPSASNDSAGGRQQNRRVEIIFSDEKGEFVPGAERVTGM